MSQADCLFGLQPVQEMQQIKVALLGPEAHSRSVLGGRLMLPAASCRLMQCQLPLSCAPLASLTWPILTKAGPRFVSISRRRCACKGVRVLQSPPRLDSRVCTSHFEMAYPAQTDVIAPESIGCLKAAHITRTPGQRLSSPAGACRLARAADVEPAHLH